MKKMVLAVSVLLVSALASAASPETPLLVKKVGGAAHAGLTSECKIYASHPKLAGKAATDVKDLIEEAKDAGPMEIVALFSHAQIPSVEIYANYINDDVSLDGGVTVEKVDLSYTYGNVSARKSAAATTLIDLANEICK